MDTSTSVPAPYASDRFPRPVPALAARDRYLLPPRWCFWPIWGRRDARTTSWRWNPWRVYLWPTPFGWGYGALLVALFLFAANYQLSLAYLTLFFAAALALAAAIQTVRHLTGLELTLTPAEPDFAGKPLLWPIRWHAPQAAIGSALMVAVRDPQTGQPLGALLPLLTPQGETLLPIPTYRRGTQPLPPLLITTTLPWGLVRAWTLWHPPLTSWAYPLPLVDAPPWPKPTGSAAYSRSELSRTLEHAHDEWHGWRATQRGEVVRRPHRQQLARRDEVWVSEWVGANDGSSDTIWLRWDKAVGKDDEERLSCLAAWIERASCAELTFGLVLPHTTLAPDRGEAHRKRALLLLARYGETPQEQLPPPPLQKERHHPQ